MGARPASSQWPHLQCAPRSCEACPHANGSWACANAGARPVQGRSWSCDAAPGKARSSIVHSIYSPPGTIASSMACQESVPCHVCPSWLSVHSGRLAHQQSCRYEVSPLCRGMVPSPRDMAALMGPQSMARQLWSGTFTHLAITCRCSSSCQGWGMRPWEVAACRSPRCRDFPRRCESDQLTLCDY